MGWAGPGRLCPALPGSARLAPPLVRLSSQGRDFEKNQVLGGGDLPALASSSLSPPAPALRTAPGRSLTPGWDWERGRTRGGAPRWPDLHGGRGPCLPSRRGLVWSDPIRSHPVPTYAEGLGKLGEKIGGDDQDPTRARGRNPRAIHGLPSEAHAGPQPPECDTGHAGHRRPDDRPEPHAERRPRAARAHPLPFRQGWRRGHRRGAGPPLQAAPNTSTGERGGGGRG